MIMAVALKHCLTSVRTIGMLIDGNYDYYLGLFLPFFIGGSGYPNVIGQLGCRIRGGGGGGGLRYLESFLLPSLLLHILVHSCMLSI